MFLTDVIETGQREKNLRDDIAATDLATQIMLNFTAICLMWFADYYLRLKMYPYDDES